MYTYPDKDDLLTCELIEKEYDGVYWADSEKQVLSQAMEKIKEIPGKKNMLDLGCGKGRLFQSFAPYVNHIVGIEPDEERFCEARDAAEALKDKAEVRYGDSRQIGQDEKFQVILMSHILQHITDSEINNILDDLKRHAAENSVVIVTTTHSGSGKDMFFEESRQAGLRKSRQIDKREFEEVYLKKDALPVRMFAEDTVIKLFEDCGFALSDKRFYHYEGHTAPREDLEKNLKGDGKGARDILYVFKRREESMDVNIGYQFSFSYFKEDRTDHIEIETGLLKDRVKQVFPKCIFEDDPCAENYQFFRDIKTAKEFLHGDGLPFINMRFLFDEYNLSMEEAEVTDTTCYMTLFPESSIAQVCISMSLKNCSKDFLVYMRHVQGNGRKLHNSDGRELSVKDIFDEISKSLGCEITDMEPTYLVEITRFGEYEKAEAVFNDNKRLLYGIMCGDEGYRNVPMSLAEERLANSWGSRDFTKLASFGSNTVFVNLNKGSIAKNYIENRRNFDHSFYGEINPYFLIESPVAGINHGVIFSAELVMVIKTISNRILSRQSSYYANNGKNYSVDIRKTKRYRGELITTLKKVENLSISEIGELERVLLAGQQIEPLVEKIKYLLELLESELDLLYQSSTNRLVNILTVAGLLLSAIGVIAQIMSM